MKLWLVATLASLATLIFPVLASAQSWSEPIQLASGDDSAVQAVEGGNRLTVAMWTAETAQHDRGRFSTSVYAADRLAGSPAWQKPTRLTADGEKSHRTRLAVSRDDRAVVLWTPSLSDGHPAMGIRVAERTGPGAWSQPREIPGVDGVIHDAAFVDSGALLIAWSRSDQTEWFVTRVDGSRWAEPVHVQLPELAHRLFGRLDISAAAFAAAPNGHLALVGVDKQLRLVAWRGHENGTWSEPVPLSLGVDNWFFPRVAAVVDANGAITAVTLDKGFKVIGARLEPGSDSWTTHHFDASEFLGLLNIILGSNGEVSAFWVSPEWMADGPVEGSSVGSPGFLQTSTRGVDGVWRPVHTFRDGERTMPVDFPSVASTQDGRPAVAWAPSESFKPANVNLSVMQPDGSWATEQIAPGYDASADNLVLGSDRRGNFTAAWSGSGRGLYVAGTDAALPRASASGPSATRSRLQVLGHRARANARWSKLRAKRLPATCRLSVAGTCTFRATINRTTARRLGLRLPKRGPYVAGSKRLRVNANAAKSTRVALKPAVRRAITRSFARNARRPFTQVTINLRNTARAASDTAVRTTAFKVTADPRRPTRKTNKRQSALGWQR